MQTKVVRHSWMWWRTPLIPALGRQRQVDLYEFEASLVYRVIPNSQCYTEKPCLRKQRNRAGEMAQPLRALTALPEVLSSNPSNHMVAHKHL